MKKYYFKRIISILLCITLVGTFITSDVEAKEVEVVQAKIVENEVSSNTMLNNPFMKDVVIFAATYIEELDSIKAIWEYPSYTSTEVYIRRDDASLFELFTTTQEMYTDIPVDIFNEYCDIRLVVITEGGIPIKSEIVSISKLEKI